jgi:uncharacterized protein YjbI with pentapeptide repeats
MKTAAATGLLALVSTSSTLAFFAGERRSRLPSTSCSLQGVKHHSEISNIAKRDFSESSQSMFAHLALASLVSLSILASPFPASADGETEKFRLPPIDFNDKTRCNLSSSTMGQANAARDKLYDLRQCNLVGAKAVGFDLSGVIMTGTDVSKANFQDAYFSKGYLQGTLCVRLTFVHFCDNAAIYSAIGII